MNREEATKKAQEKNPAYEIPFENAEAAKSFTGKTLSSKDPNNKSTIEIVEWIGQNYLVRINGTDYNATPVMWVIKNRNSFIIS